MTFSVGVGATVGGIIVAEGCNVFVGAPSVFVSDGTGVDDAITVGMPVLVSVGVATIAAIWVLGVGANTNAEVGTLSKLFT